MFTENRDIYLRGFFWAISVVLALLFFGANFTSFSNVLDIQYLKQTGFYSWAVLLLCIIWLYIKRNEINISTSKIEKTWALVGLALFVPAAALLHYLSVSNGDLPFRIFAIGLVAVACFSIFFGRASKLPLMLISVYGIAVGFPLLVEYLFAASLSRATAVLSIASLQQLGVPISVDGVTVTLRTLIGYDIVTIVDARCSGSDSLAVFLAIFALMLIDKKPKNTVVIGFFALGIIGTYVQNLIRLLLLYEAGYHFGSNSLWMIHDYASYVIFPLWFLIFSVIYLKYTNKAQISCDPKITPAEI